MAGTARCPGAGESEVTYVAPVTGAGEALKACPVRSGGPGLSSLPGLFIGPLPLLTRETYTPDHRQAAAQSDDA